MYYPEELIEEIRMKNDIVSVISGYVRMQKKGSSYFGARFIMKNHRPSRYRPRNRCIIVSGAGQGAM